MIHQGNANHLDKDIYAVFVECTLYVEGGDREDAFEAAKRVLNEFTGNYDISDVMLHDGGDR